MEAPQDSLFDALSRDVARQQRSRKRHVAFEERVMRRILKHYRLLDEVRELHQLCYDHVGERHLLFAWFHHRHPDFPMWLTMRRMPDLHKQEGSHRLPRPDRLVRSRLFHAFETAELDNSGYEKPVGLVYTLLGCGALHGLEVLHTADVDRGWEGSSILIVKATESGHRRFWIDSLDVLLHDLRWSP